MTGKYYMLFRDGDIFEQLHWFVDNYIPASRQTCEYAFIKSVECWGAIRSGVQGVYTWDNGKFISLCFFDKLMFCTDITKDYIQVFYDSDTINIGELQ